MSLNVQSFQEKKYQATIAQQHDFSCGSAALATLLSYNYNIPVSETAVFNDMILHGNKQVISESGFSLLDIKNFLTRNGLESNGYRAPLSKLAEVRLPAIVLLNVRGYRHFVVLEGIEKGRVLLSDPANGMRSEPIGVFEIAMERHLLFDLEPCRPRAAQLQQRPEMGVCARAAMGPDTLRA